MIENPENPPLPTSPDALLARLDDLGITYDLHHHEPIYTAADGQHLKTVIPGIHCKNLFIRDKKERMALVVVPDDLTVDLKALAPAIGLDRLSFGSPERLWTYLGVRPGSVCPYAAMNDTGNLVKVILDTRIANAPFVVAHPMLNTMSIAVAIPGLLRFLGACGHEPQVVELPLAAQA